MVLIFASQKTVKSLLQMFDFTFDQIYSKK